MIDHLLLFPSRDAAGAALAPLGLAFENKGAYSFAANVILNVGGPNDESIRVVIQDAVWDRSDPPRLTTPEVLAPGWYCVVCEAALKPPLRDLPNNICRSISDRDKAVAGDPQFITYLAKNTDPQLLANARIEPTALGSRYPFGTQARSAVLAAQQRMAQITAQVE